MPLSLGYVLPDWLHTPDGKILLNSITIPRTNRRKRYALLESPSYPPEINPDVYEYKILVSGKTGVGKTSTVAKLSANTIPSLHSETPGIETSVVFWPARVSGVDRAVMFKLHFWDVGETVLKKFDHILPACRAQTDAVLFTFAFTDKSSFDDLPQQMSRVLDNQDNVCKLVIGTKLDMQAHVEVTRNNVLEFENHWGLAVLVTSNEPHQEETSSDLSQVSSILNYLCDRLWHRDHTLSHKLTQS